MHIHGHRLGHAADVDVFAAAPQRIDRVDHGPSRRTGSEAIDRHVDAEAAGERARPLGNRLVFQRQHLDAPGGQRLHPRQEIAPPPSAEDAGSAAPERNQRGAEPERTADAVDEHRVTRPGTGLAQCRVGSAEITQPRGLLEADVVG